VVEVEHPRRAIQTLFRCADGSGVRTGPAGQPFLRKAAMSAAEPTACTLTCAATGKTISAQPKSDGSPKLPKGWKRIAGQIYSPEGRKRLYCPRSIRVPVASVVAEYDPPDWSMERCRQGWQAFRQAVKSASREAAQIANAMLFELARLDSLPLVDGEKGKTLPKWPMSTKDIWKRLYHVGREQFPAFDSQSLSAIRQRAWARYNDRERGRFQVRVLGTVSLPSFRDGIPVPLAAKDVKLWFGDSKKPFLRFRLQSQRFTVRLRGGWKFARQVAALQKAAAQSELLGEVSLCLRMVGNSHHNGGRARAQPGANRKKTEIIAAVSILLPRDQSVREDKTLIVKTSKDRLWQVLLEGREQLWDLNEDQAKRWVTAHRARLFRVSQDRKFERCRPRKERAGLNGLTNDLSKKYEDRLADWAHKAARMLVNFARRQRCCRIEYDDRETDFCPGLPWFKLRSMCEQKSQECGIEFVHSSGSGEKAQA
jgi:hypothetical protein